MERKNKYIVIKREDIDECLLEEDVHKLYGLLVSINRCKRIKGEKINRYVVVNEKEPYAEIIWKLIEISQDNPEGLKVLLANLDSELKGF